MSGCTPVQKTHSPMTLSLLSLILRERLTHIAFATIRVSLLSNQEQTHVQLFVSLSEKGFDMYTVEIEPDASIITTLDQKDDYNDVEVVFADDGTVYIRQYDEQMNEHQVIYMSSQQWLDIYSGYKSPVGAYYVDLKGVSK